MKGKEDSTLIFSGWETRAQVYSHPRQLLHQERDRLDQGQNDQGQDGRGQK